jgi:hypothetical protein
MSEKITNTFIFYGNEKIDDLEQEMIKRFQHDQAQGNDEMTAVKRILFGLQQDADFNNFAQLGADWACYFGSTKRFELESKQCGVVKLQDHITRCAAKIDPDVVVQMDYVGNTPTLIGTRFSCLSTTGEIIATTSEEYLNCSFCDEVDVDDLIAELEENGEDDIEVMSYQSLKNLIATQKESASYEFNKVSGKDPIEVEDEDS